MSETLVRPRRAARRSRRPFRTDIQSLRALAVALVLVNHLWPTRLPGGYVGVDVFFVISGYLITAHLTGELQRTGRVRLSAFYARRIRRLLPAAFLVLGATAALVAIYLPYSRWERNAWEIIASAAYFENFFLAGMSVDYSALNQSASAVQHYWSLSVEEQFYIVWPVILIVGVFTARRLGRDARSTLMLSVATVATVSLVASVVITAEAPSQAYFVPFTRAWEFAAGGLVALTAHRWRLSSWSSNALSLVGFGLIASSAIGFDHETPFPGWMALVPVVGTAGVIVAGSTGHALWHSLVTSRRPVQWLGGVSYSLYLWHWPLIVVAPFAIRAELSFGSRIAVLVVALLLAAATKRFVEDPAQRASLWSASSRRAFVGMLLGVSILVASSTGLIAQAQQRLTQSDTASAQIDPCAGPRALAPAAACGDPFGSPDYAVMTARNEYFAMPEECGDFLSLLEFGEKKTTRVCDFSENTADPTRVWLVGDSHAQQWQGAVFDIARERGWHLTTSYYGGCPIADVPFEGFRVSWPVDEAERCMDWSHAASEMIAQDRPDLVITAMASRQQLLEGEDDVDRMATGLLRFWEEWNERGIRVVAIADPPFNGEVRNADCVLLNEANPRSCARPRAEAQPIDPVLIAGGGADTNLTRTIDLTGSFCDPALCYAVVGGVPVYYDADHLNLEYVQLLEPQVETTVDAVLAATPG